MFGELTFILGGARSGKSTLAEQLARQGERVLYVATAEGRDEEMRRRIAAHRAARPEHWDTVEEPLELVAALRPIRDRYDTVLVDCLTLWVSNLLLQRQAAGEAVDAIENRILNASRELLHLVANSGGGWIMVSNEVGLGVVAGLAAGARLPRPAGPGKPDGRRASARRVPDGGRPPAAGKARRAATGRAGCSAARAEMLRPK